MDALSLRHDYRRRIELANETDSKSTDLKLRKEAAACLKDLKATCKHEGSIVVTRSEYGGSHSYDYDDAHPEYRICLCCGTQETGWNFSTSKIEPKLVGIPIARFEGTYPDQIENPLSYPLSEAIDTAKKKGYIYFGKRIK